MSETELVNSVLYWYIPFVFGLYGLAATRVKKSAGDSENSAIRHMFSGNDSGLLILGISLIVLSGFIGFFLFAVPLTSFKLTKKRYDLLVAATGSVLWLILLFIFFQVIWPSL